jgi:hypothetical protein
MKRLSLGGSCLQVKRERDKYYLYTANPSPIHHKSNKINHYLKIVDFYISAKTPERFLIEPIFGSYEPDVFFKDTSNNSICVEIQLTPISTNKMETKIKQFVKEYGKEHDAKILVICSDYNYNKIKSPNGFKIIKQPLPKEIQF